MIKLLENDILLFQGDSITHGGRGESKTDMNHIIGHGYQSILASKIGLENIDRRPEIVNRGVSGDTVSKLLARWNEDTIALRPTVLSILIGVNDSLVYESVKLGPTSEDFDKLYRTLLDYTVEKLPNTKLIIGEPFAFQSPKSLIDENEREMVDRRIKYIREISEYIAKIAQDYKAVFVPYYNELKKYVDNSPVEHIVWDGVHPTYVGHEIMARLWYDTVDKSGILK